MASHDALRAHILDLLGPLDVVARAMFGGVGFFKDGAMFGLIAGDSFYLKTDDSNRAAYEEAGSAPFTYDGKGKPVVMPYHTAPEELLEDADVMRARAPRTGRDEGTHDIIPRQAGPAALDHGSTQLCRPGITPFQKGRALAEGDVLFVDLLDCLEGHRRLAMGIPGGLQAFRLRALHFQGEPQPVLDAVQRRRTAHPDLAGGRAAQGIDAKYGFSFLPAENGGLPRDAFHCFAQLANITRMKLTKECRRGQ